MLAFDLLNVIKWSLDDPEDLNWMHMLIFSPFKYSSSLPTKALKEESLEPSPSLGIAPWNPQQYAPIFKSFYLLGSQQIIS